MSARLVAASLAAVLASPVAASAQTVQVEQVHAPAAATAVRQLADPERGPESRPRQLGPRAADPRLQQMTDPARARGPSPQVQPGPPDRSLRVAAPPPEAVDACEEAAEGKRKPPPGLDCATVLEAAALARASEPEARLLTGAADTELSTSRARVRAARQVVPDADTVARRLGAGDVQDDPIAQAVAAGLTDQPQAEPEPRPAQPPPTITVTPGGTTPPPDGGG